MPGPPSIRGRFAPTTRALSPASLPDVRTLARALEATGELAVVGFKADGSVAAWLPGAESMLGIAEGTGEALTFGSMHDPALQAELFGGFGFGKGSISHGAEAVVQARSSTGHILAFTVTFGAAEPGEAPVAWWGVYRQRRPSADGGGSSGDDRRHDLLVYTVEALHNGLVILEMAGNRVVFVNDAFLGITGLRKGELYGNTFDCSLAEWPGLRQCLLPHIEDMKVRGRAAGSAHWEVELPSGVKTLQVYGQPIFPEKGANNFLLVVFDDITEKQQLANQLVQSEKLAAIGQLAAGIAHEMRSPLQAIMGALYELRELTIPGNAEAAENIGIATEEISRVQEIINNLLDFARESKRDEGVAHVNETIERTLRLIAKDLQVQGIETNTEFAEVPPARISPNALKQILINLLTNARQSMGRGGRLTVRTEVRDGPVHHGLINHRPGVHVPQMSYGDPSRERQRRQIAASATRHVILHVSDTGCGIAPENLPMVFNPFFTTKEPGEGTGLGLSVVHSQVRDHGGMIYVDSDPGRGTTFTVRLPAEGTEEDDPRHP